ncbi:hypothetical protein JYT79_02370 [Cardiobacterium sp. AH-315-I02]|nr:hypothetical protein [Cardiobacterium sp. AH-315-I02]
MYRLLSSLFLSRYHAPRGNAVANAPALRDATRHVETRHALSLSLQKRWCVNRCITTQCVVTRKDALELTSEFYVLYRLLSSLFLLLLLASCASTEKFIIDTAVEQPGNYQFNAWQMNPSIGNGAINSLLDDVDTLIINQEFDAATDKLERILRIKPQYAPAWSRLSWLALQENAPERAVQMAKRSNSFAFSDAELQLLNWSFIRDASMVLDDETAYNHANQKLESLKRF